MWVWLVRWGFSRIWCFWWISLPRSGLSWNFAEFTVWSCFLFDCFWNLEVLGVLSFGFGWFWCFGFGLWCLGLV